MAKGAANITDYPERNLNVTFSSQSSNMMNCQPNPHGSEKKDRYVLILNEIEKFSNPKYGQRLSLIQKKVWPNDKNAKQKLNYYLQRFLKMELIEKFQSRSLRFSLPV